MNRENLIKQKPDMIGYYNGNKINFLKIKNILYSWFIFEEKIYAKAYCIKEKLEKFEVIKKFMLEKGIRTLQLLKKREAIKSLNIFPICEHK